MSSSDFGQFSQYHELFAALFEKIYVMHKRNLNFQNVLGISKLSVAVELFNFIL